jgi:hypothetical protein
MFTEVQLGRRRVRYSPIDTMGSHLGDRQVLMLEAVLTNWRLDFGQSVNRVMDGYFGSNRQHLQRGLEAFSANKHCEDIDRLTGAFSKRTKPACQALAAYAEVAFDVPVLNRLPYDRVIKVLPFSKTPAVFAHAADDIAGLADAGSFTLLFAISHGFTSGLIGRYDLGYQLILDKLAQIPGKKLIIVLACHSGAIIDALRSHPQKQDFLVIASAGKDETGSNWGNEALMREMIGNSIDGRPVSQFALSSQNFGRETQTPEIFGYYDVIV